MENSKYSLSLSDSGKYVLLDINGIITPEFARVFSYESDLLALEHKISSFLMDMRGARNMASKKSNLDYVKEENSQLIDDSKKKIALLIDKIDRSHDMVTWMLQKKGVNIKVFYTYEEAVKFLEF